MRGGPSWSHAHGEDDVDEIDMLLRAVWTLTRHAKRYRDRAQAHYLADNHRWATWSRKRKEAAYRVKGQVVARLIEAGVLTTGHGHHRFGRVYAEVIRGRGYTFHRPAPQPADPEGVDDLGQVEAKPKSSRELGVREAFRIAEEYLAGKPALAVYEWPPQISRPRRYCWNCGSPDHLAADCDDDFEDEWDDYDTDLGD